MIINCLYIDVSNNKLISRILICKNCNFRDEAENIKFI